MRSSSGGNVREPRTSGRSTPTKLITEVLPVLDSPKLAEPLPLQRAYYWERAAGARRFLTQPVGDSVRHWNWREAMGEARRVGAYLKAQKWENGSRIVILSRNCSWWVMAELAVWMAGYVTVPIYTSITTEAAKRLIEHCEPVACFIGPLDNPAVVACLDSSCTTCIRFPNAAPCPGIEWESLIRETVPLEGTVVRSANDLATIIYTSGTTGSPKGAMHRFGAFPYFAKAVTQVVGENTDHRVLSYLPLAHIAERALTETTAIYQGWHIFFSESTATFMRDLKRARPTVFFSVPRLYAKFRQGVLEKVPQQKLERLLKIPLVRSFVRRKILRGLGLNAVRFAASGSAAISADLLKWFREVGLLLSEGYGTTETGITHTAPKGQFRAGCVGRNAPGVETKLGENREVLVRSPMNMLGYYQDPAGTQEVFTEQGFIRTGDLGRLDEDRWLKIDGRIKEQFKTSKGEYVLPSAIEGMLSGHPAIETCMVMGAGLAAPFAVAVLSDEALKAAATDHPPQALARSLEALLETTNGKLAAHERLKFVVLVDSKWTMGRGFITPTLKLKRAVLESYYAPFISDWIARETKLIWHSDS
jgi:long-chain acyl-CoA synthetase